MYDGPLLRALTYKPLSYIFLIVLSGIFTKAAVDVEKTLSMTSLHRLTSSKNRLSYPTARESLEESPEYRN